MEDRSDGEYIGAIPLVVSVNSPVGSYKPKESSVPSIVLPILIHTKN